MGDGWETQRGREVGGSKFILGDDIEFLVIDSGGNRNPFSKLDQRALIPIFGIGRFYVGEQGILAGVP